MRGFVAYGPERWQGRTLHTFELVLELLARSTLPIAEMVIHEFALDDYREALSASYARAKSGALTCSGPEAGR